jgi:Flp pilus assembly protein TadD
MTSDPRTPSQSRRPLARLRPWAAAGPSARLGAALVALLAVAAYANSLANDFAYDDYAIVLRNPQVREPDPVRILTAPYWPRRAGAEAGLYRPVTTATLALDWAIWGRRALGFHLTNVWTHALASVLLFLLLRRWAAPGGAAVGAALFAVHPVHTEAVANVVGRAEILAAAFAFAALLCLPWRRGTDAASAEGGAPGAARPSGKRDPAPAAGPDGERVRHALAALFYALAVGAKESAIVLPGLLVAADAAAGAFRETSVRAYVRRRAHTFAWLGAAGLAMLAARVAVLGRLASAEPADAFVPDASFATRFFTMIRVWPHYVRLLVAPLDLSADYSPAVILPTTEPTLLGGLGLLLAAAAAVLAMVSWRAQPRVTAGIAWIAIAILPVSNLFFVTGVLLAERTLYLPSAGVALLAAAGWERWRASTRSRAPTAVAGLAVALFAALCIRRNPDWRDGAAVFNRLREDHPESYRAQWALAGDWVRRGQEDSASRWYALAYRVWPHNYAFLLDYAGHLLRRGNLGAAAHVAEQGIGLRPEVPPAWELLAVAYLRTGRTREAAALARRAPEPVRAGRWFAALMATALERTGDTAAAGAWTARARAAGPTPESWVSLYETARLLLDVGDTARARLAIREGMAIAADDSTAAMLLSRLEVRAAGPTGRPEPDPR